MMRPNSKRGIEGFGSFAESTIPDKYGCIYIKHGNYVVLSKNSSRFLDAWEKWTNEYDCVLQANDGCDKCNLEDFDLDWCPFHE